MAEDWQPATIEEWARELADVTGLLAPEVLVLSDCVAIVLTQLVHIGIVDLAGDKLIDVAHRFNCVTVRIEPQEFLLDAEDLLFEIEQQINETIGTRQ